MKKLFFAMATWVACGMAWGQTPQAEFGTWAYEIGIVPGCFTVGSGGQGPTLIAVVDEESGDIVVYDRALRPQATIHPQGELAEVRYQDVDANGAFVDVESAMWVTQTLFDSDADYEYVTQTGDALQVRKQDGSVVQEVPCDEGYEVEAVWVWRLNGECYLVVGMWNREADVAEKTVMYLIDRPTQSIVRVADELPLAVRPSVALRGQQVTVQLGEGVQATQIEVVNARGQVVRQVAVPEGQREVVLTSEGLGSGMYLLHAHSGSRRGTYRIVVK